MSFKPANKFIPLKKIPANGTLAVTAPASPVEADDLERGVRYLEKNGYRVKVGASCYSKEYYLAGSDELRGRELLQFFADSSVDAIICARGGHGSMRLLNRLDYTLIRRSRKPFIGFSDVTALQWAIYAKAGLPTISGGMVATDMARQPVAAAFEEPFWKFIQTGRADYRLDHKQEREMSLSGICMAGTASMAAKLMGTPYMPDLKRKLLILEDVDEPTHKIEGYLLQFALAGIYSESAAVILGKFRKAEREQYPEVPGLNEVFNRAFEGCERPRLYNLPYGHIPEKIPLPVGAPLSLSLGPTTRLKSQESIFES